MIAGRWISPLCLMLLLFAARPAVAQIRAEAYEGEPFGVARVVVPLDPADAKLEVGRLVLDAGGRTLYPVFAGAPPRPILNFLGVETTPRSVEVYFLFRGNEPFRCEIRTPRPVTVDVAPRFDDSFRPEQLLQTWRQHYVAQARERLKEGDYPPIAEIYLTSMLCRRLDLEAPSLAELGVDQPREPQQTLEYLAGADKMRAATMLDTLEADFDRSPDATVINRPLPPAIGWAPLEAPVLADPAVEPLAMHVPEECFYIRFGSFEHYQWVNRLMGEYGGDIQQMVTLRGHNYNINQRITRQFCLNPNDLREMFGSQAVADIALIGRDLYVKEGAALGILFLAKNDIFSVDILAQRREVLADYGDPSIEDKTVMIAGRKVRSIVSPDNRLRSFYAQDGRYHLITTSKAIVERFFACSEGAGSLGALSDFRHARSLMPIDRDDTVFAYFSSPFMQGLVSPQYQIELGRRLKAVTDMELIQLARLSAKAEGVPGDTIEALIAADLLPEGFGRQVDGSGVIIADHQLIDSLRGARGSFLPIPDVPLTGTTFNEEADYLRRARFYETDWRQFDPLMVGIKRFALDGKDLPGAPDVHGLERLVIDANVSPFDEEKYGWLTSILGPPLKERIVPTPGDVIHVQASVRGGLLLPGIPAHHLFLGVQDAEPLLSFQPNDILRMLILFRTTPGYLGAWPKPGYLDLLPIGFLGRPDAFGYTRLLFGLWRWQGRGFSVLSFDRGVLDRAATNVQPVPTEDPAQVRVSVGDLSSSKLSSLLNTMYYERARKASVGNAQMLQMLTNQFRVSQADALTTAESLLGVDLICTLGGKYELQPNRFENAEWRSTAWTLGDQRRLPPDYQAQALTWFRGLELGLIKQEGRMQLHAELDMQRKATDPKPAALPLFDWLGGKKAKPE